MTRFKYLGVDPVFIPGHGTILPGEYVAMEDTNPVLLSSPALFEDAHLSDTNPHGLMSLGGLLKPDLLPASEGENYIVVQTTSDPIQNGLNLKAALDRAATLTPNGLALSYNNNVTVFLPPAFYDLNGASITVRRYVSISGIGGDYTSVFIYSKGNASDGYALFEFSGYNYCIGVSIVNDAAGVVANASKTDRHSAVIRFTYGQCRFERCCFCGKNIIDTMGSGAAGTNQVFKNCCISVYDGIRYIKFQKWTFDSCFGSEIALTPSGFAFQIVGCTVMGNQLILINTSVDFIDFGGTGRAINCASIRYYATAGNTCTSLNDHYGCRSVRFMGADALNEIETIKSYFVGCTIELAGALNISLLHCVNCCVNISPTGALAPAAVLLADAKVLLLGCSVTADVAGRADSNILFGAGVTGTGTLALERSSLYNGFTIPAAYTVLTGELAAKCNVVSESTYSPKVSLS